MPRTILPVPPQAGHSPPCKRPVPWHSGQTSSPVPGVPAGASSAEFIRPGVRGVSSPEFGVCRRPYRALLYRNTPNVAPAVGFAS
jgi:hypothetical protein